jgi:hypothetical protein
MDNRRIPYRLPDGRGWLARQKGRADEGQRHGRSIRRLSAKVAFPDAQDRVFGLW